MPEAASQQELGLGWKKTIIYSLLPLVLLLGSLEGCARVYEMFYPPLPLDYGWGFNEESRLFVPDSEHGGYVTNPQKAKVSFRVQRFQMPKPANTFRIFILGGSNINMFKEYQDALVEALEGKADTQLRVEAINCGGNAYGSQRLLLIAKEIMQYGPDLVMLYSGHNEFEEKEQLHYVDTSTIPLQRIAFASAFMRLVRDRIAYMNVSWMQREINAAVLSPDVDLAGTYFPPDEVEARMEAYERNLTGIIETCLEHGVAVVLGTVASNMMTMRVHVNDVHHVVKLQEMYEAGQYAEGYAFARSFLPKVSRHQASDAENGIILSLAEGYDLPVADVRGAIRAAEPNGVPGETLFVDHCHLTSEGFYILAREYVKAIAPLLESTE